MQERQAERAVEALSAYLPPHATACATGAAVDRRDASWCRATCWCSPKATGSPPTPGCSTGAVEVDLSTLTGESLPVDAQPSAAAGGAPLLEAADLVFSGTTCTGGEARAVVFATGMHTELGRIAALSQRVGRDDSPLERAGQAGRPADRARRGRCSVPAFLPLGALVAGLPLRDAVDFAIGLLVANVPEGLLPTITLALAVGVRALADAAGAREAAHRGRDARLDRRSSAPTRPAP